MKYFFYVAAIFLLLPHLIFAHGTGYRVNENAATIAVDFFYSDKAPMQYSEVILFSPENEEIEYQNGWTDQMGRFAFCPNVSGAWRIQANDGTGHLSKATINVHLEDNRAEAPAATDPAPDKVFSGKARFFLGLSLLLNIFMGLYIWKKK